MNYHPITPGIAKQLLNKEYIPAIKEYRNLYGADLKEAKDAIDSVRNNTYLLNDIINDVTLDAALTTLSNIAKELIDGYPNKAIDVINLIIKLRGI
jgi:hypothetical protein